jgi:hypothetical protein
MKRHVRFLVAIVAATFILAGTVLAAPVTFNYTADNIIGGWFQNGGSPVPLSLGPNDSTWWVSDTETIDLNIGETYQIIWQTHNDLPAPGPGNPGGFLAEISPSVPLQVNSLLSSATWEVAHVVDDLSTPTDFNSLTWVSATAYNTNNDPNGIWYQVGISPKPSNSPVAGISGNAQWIWTAANFGDSGAPDNNDSVFVKVTVQPVPEPGTILLLGFGLLGLVGYGIHRKKKNS